MRLDDAAYPRREAAADGIALRHRGERCVRLGFAELDVEKYGGQAYRDGEGVELAFAREVEDLEPRGAQHRMRTRFGGERRAYSHAVGYRLGAAAHHAAELRVEDLVQRRKRDARHEGHHEGPILQPQPREGAEVLRARGEQDEVGARDERARVGHARGEPHAFGARERRGAAAARYEQLFLWEAVRRERGGYRRAEVSEARYPYRLSVEESVSVFSAVCKVRHFKNSLLNLKAMRRRSLCVRAAKSVPSLSAQRGERGQLIR